MSLSDLAAMLSAPHSSIIAGLVITLVLAGIIINLIARRS